MKCQVSSYSLVWLNSLCNVMRVNITRCSLCSTYAVTLPPGIHRCCGHYFRQWNSLSTEFPQSLYSLQFERFFYAWQVQTILRKLIQFLVLFTDSKACVCVCGVFVCVFCFFLFDICVSLVGFSISTWYQKGCFFKLLLWLNLMQVFSFLFPFCFSCFLYNFFS